MALQTEDIKRLRKLYKEQYDATSVWRNHWKDVVEFVSPGLGKHLVAEEHYTQEGAKKHDSIYNEIAEHALGVLVSGLHGGLTSPSRPWFQLTLADEDLADERSVRIWLQLVRDLLLRVFARSNFYPAVHSLYYELGSPGTAVMIENEDDTTLVRFHPLTVGEYLLGTDATNRVDTLHRKMMMTARQMVELWGLDAVSTNVKKAYENQSQQTFSVIHVIAPRTRRDLLAETSTNMPFFSVYYEEAGNQDKLLYESGYMEMPFVAPRWRVIGTDTYGRSPGMVALASTKMTQRMEKDKLTGLAKFVNPPMRASGSVSHLTVVPGGVSTIESADPQAWTPAYQISNLPIRELGEEIMRVEQRIGACFYKDLFLSILSEGKQMTAREVAERHDEKLLLLGPTLESIQGEMLDLIINRTFQIVLRRGLIPEPPRELQGMDLRVEYIGLLAQAQKLVGTFSVEQFGSFVGAVASMFPDALDKVDFDEVVEHYADMLGIPARLLRQARDVELRRRQRAQQAQAAAAMDRAPDLAAGAKQLSEVNLAPNSALQATISGLASANQGLAGGV